MELKLQHFHSDLADKTQWMSDTETLLKSPAFNLDDENITSDKVSQQSELVEVTFKFCGILWKESLNEQTNYRKNEINRSFDKLMVLFFNDEICVLGGCRRGEESVIV